MTRRLLHHRTPEGWTRQTFGRGYGRRTGMAPGAGRSAPGAGRGVTRRELPAYLRPLTRHVPSASGSLVRDRVSRHRGEGTYRKSKTKPARPRGAGGNAAAPAPPRRRGDSFTPSPDGLSRHAWRPWSVRWTIRNNVPIVYRETKKIERTETTRAYLPQAHNRTNGTPPTGAEP